MSHDFEFVTSFPGKEGSTLSTSSTEGKLAFAAGYFSPGLFISDDHFRAVFGSSDPFLTAKSLCDVDAWERANLPVLAGGDISKGLPHPSFWLTKSSEAANPESELKNGTEIYDVYKDHVQSRSDERLSYPLELLRGSMSFDLSEYKDSGLQSFDPAVPALVKSFFYPGRTVQLGDGVEAIFTRDSILLSKSIEVYGQQVDRISLTDLNVFKSVLVSLLASASDDIKYMID